MMIPPDLNWPAACVLIAILLAACSIVNTFIKAMCRPLPREVDNLNKLIERAEKLKSSIDELSNEQNKK